MSMGKKKGFIAILTVIALLAFSVSLMFAATYLSIDQSQSGLVLSQGEAALQLTEGCTEDALLLSRRDENYEGGTSSYLGGTCEVSIEKVDTVWTITVTGTKSDFERRIRVVIDRAADPEPESPATLTLSSWLEQ